MNIVFLKKAGLKTPYENQNRIELYPDTPWEHAKYHPWDDFGYKTTFNAKLLYENKEYELPSIKVLIENKEDTHEAFKKLLKKSNKKYFTFPIEGYKYVSLPTDTLWYKTLYSLASEFNDTQLIVTVLDALHDASYIKHTNNLHENIDLLDSEGFSNSLLRDMTARNAFEFGWQIIESNQMDVKNLAFNIEFKLENYTNKHKIEINFKKSIFPNNINVLIGSNGTGKSQTLSYLIDQFLGIGKTQQLEKIPNFNQIVMIAYSPYESFRTSLDDVAVNIKSVYKYFGFKDENRNFNDKLPYVTSIDSIISMIKDDKDKNYILGRPNKFNTFVKVMKKAIDFDSIALPIEETGFPSSNILDSKYYIIDDIEDFIGELAIYIDNFRKEEGIVFIKNNEVIPLSSGQQIFSQLISSIISVIREDTILLIDEPELYLHPNLEVELIDLLKELLDIYKSYAVIATHSAIVSREVPGDYTAVLKRKKEKIKISRPPFETFGGDLERINAYVFYDKDIDKPFEKWLQKLVNDAGGAEKAIKKYGKQLNEESIILMYGMKVENAD